MEKISKILDNRKSNTQNKFLLHMVWFLEYRHDIFYENIMEQCFEKLVSNELSESDETIIKDIINVTSRLLKGRVDEFEEEFEDDEEPAPDETINSNKKQQGFLKNFDNRPITFDDGI